MTSLVNNNPQNYRRDEFYFDKIPSKFYSTTEGQAFHNYESEPYSVSDVDYKILLEQHPGQNKYFVISGGWEFEAQLQGNTWHFLDAEGNAKCLIVKETVNSGILVRSALVQADDTPTGSVEKKQIAGFTFKLDQERQVYATDRFLIGENRYFIMYKKGEEQFFVVKFKGGAQQLFEATLFAADRPYFRFKEDGVKHDCQFDLTNVKIEEPILAKISKTVTPKEKTFEITEENNAVQHPLRDPAFIFLCLLGIGLFLSAAGIGATTGFDKIPQYGYFITAGLTVLGIASLVGSVIRWQCTRCRYARA
jgi:hypothetical protein